MEERGREAGVERGVMIKDLSGKATKVTKREGYRKSWIWEEAREGGKRVMRRTWEEHKKVVNMRTEGEEWMMVGKEKEAQQGCRRCTHAKCRGEVVETGERGSHNDK